MPRPQGSRRARCLAVVRAVLEPLEPRLLLSGLPAPFTDTDIGSPSTSGTASYTVSSNQWSVTGAGAGISGASDQFHYAYENWNVADGSLIAEVGTGSYSGSGAQAGVMFRDTTNANAQFVAVTVNANHIVNLEYRTSTGGSEDIISTSSSINPSWVELVENQSGSTDGFTGYYSTNGTSWTQIGSTVNLGSSHVNYAGLAVTSGNAGNTNTVTFSNFMVNQTLSAATTLSASEEVLPNSTLTIESNLTINSGVTLTVDSGATVNSDGAYQTNNGNIDINGGTLNVSGGAYEDFTNNGNINITSGSLNMNISFRSFVQAMHWRADDGINGSSGSSFSIFANYGIIDASGGAISIAGYLNSTGSYAAAGPAIANYGTITANGGAIDAEIVYAAGSYGSYNGYILNSGTITASAGGYVELNASNANANTYVINSAYGIIRAYSGGSINITSGDGSYNIFATRLNTFINYGTIDAEGGAISLASYSSYLNNSGTLEVDGGSLSINSGGEIYDNTTSTYSIFTNYGTIENSGTVSVNDGSLTVDNYGGGQFVNSNIFDVTDGTVSIGGYDHILTSSSTFTNSGIVGVTGGTVSIAGYLTPDSYDASGGPPIYNAGVINADGGTITLSVTGDYANGISNWGTIAAADGGAINISAANASGSYINNSGTLETPSNGTLDIQGHLTLSSGSTNTVGAGGTLEFTGSSQTLAGSGQITLSGGQLEVASSDTLIIDNGITITGGGNITGNLDVLGNAAIGTGDTLTVTPMGNDTFSGVISGSGNLTLNGTTGTSLTLSGVDLSQIQLTVDPGAILYVENGLTLSYGASVTVDAGAKIDFINGTGSSQVLAGSGQIALSGGQLEVGASDMLTIDSGITISGGGLTCPP